MLKNIILLLLSYSATCLAHEGHVHAKHNMVLFGEAEIFASHIVYKTPHNYQVILSLSLSPADREKYLLAKRANPSEQFIYLLDAMDIKDIASLPFISGPVFYLDAAGNKHEVISSLRLEVGDFKIIYFNELPLSLGAEPTVMGDCAPKVCPQKCLPGSMCINGTCSPVF